LQFFSYNSATRALKSYSLLSFTTEEANEAVVWPFDRWLYLGGDTAGKATFLLTAVRTISFSIS